MKKVMSKILGTSVLTLLLCVMFMANGNALKANAYYSGRASNVAQTNPATTSLTLTWTAAPEAATYQISVSEDAGYEIKGTTSACSFTVRNLTPGKKYDVRVTAYSKTGEDGYSAYAYDLKTLTDRVSGFKQGTWYKSLKKVWLDWDRVGAADSYQVTLYNSKNKKVATKTFTGSSTYATFEKLKHETYKATISATTTINGKKYNSPVTTIYCMQNPTTKTCKISSSKLKLKWQKVTGATGYDIYVSTNYKSGYKKVKSVKANTTSATIAKFKKKKFSKSKRYYVIIEAKKKVGNTTYKSGKGYYSSASRY